MSNASKPGGCSGEARNAIPCTCPNPALHEVDCPYVQACAPYGRCSKCSKPLTLPPSFPGVGPSTCGDCWRAARAARLPIYCPNCGENGATHPEPYPCPPIGGERTPEACPHGDEPKECTHYECCGPAPSTKEALTGVAKVFADAHRDEQAKRPCPNEACPHGKGMYRCDDSGECANAVARASRPNEPAQRADSASPTGRDLGSCSDLDALERRHKDEPNGELSRTIMVLCEGLRIRRHESWKYQEELARQRTEPASPWRGRSEDGSVGFDCEHEGRRALVTFASDGDVEILITERKNGGADLAAGQPRVSSRGEEAGETAGATPGKEGPGERAEEAPVPGLELGQRGESPRQPVVWADEMTPLSGPEAKALLDENEALRKVAEAARDAWLVYDAGDATDIVLDRRMCDLEEALGELNQLEVSQSSSEVSK